MKQVQVYIPTCICRVNAQSFTCVQRIRGIKGEERRKSKEIKLLIVYGSQFSSLPVSIRRGYTIEKEQMMRWRGWRWRGLSIMESRPLTGFQMLFTCHSQSLLAHTHTHANIRLVLLCLSACELLILITQWSEGHVPSHHTMSNLIRNSKRVGGSTSEREAAV